MDRTWTLTVEFDDPKEQIERDPENAFPYDEGSRFIAFLCEHWSLLPDELDDTSLIEWSQTKVVLRPEVLDYIVEPTEWILMHTVPKRMELSR